MTSPSAPPTTGVATRAYVALIQGYWNGILAADGATANTNATARACLGALTNSAPQNVNLVDPPTCHVHALANLAVQEKFLADLQSTTAPRQFADDDNVFRTQVPQAIAAMRTLVAVSTKNEKRAVFDAANAFLNVMYASILPAMDHVDPSTRHG